jgi:hypothetical protein
MLNLDKDKEFPVINIEFKDGSILSHCVIFNEDPNGIGVKGNEKALININKINDKFKKLPWYSRWDGWIYFQNKYINGHCHVENIKSYEIVFVTNEEF